MWRIAAIRALLSGGLVGAVGLRTAEQSGSSNGPVLLVAAISGATTIIVALIYVVGGGVMNRRRERDPAFIATQTEAVDALAEQLVRQRAAHAAEIEELEGRLVAERDRHDKK